MSADGLISALLLATAILLGGYGLWRLVLWFRDRADGRGED